MTVLPDHGRAKGAADLYTVVSDSGREYLVDVREGACECDDAFYRGTECIHQRRVKFATGERAIPTWANRDAVDDQLGTHVEDGPQWAAADGGEILVAGDEGEILDDGDDDQDDEECACDGLPEGVPCADCYINDGATFETDQ